MECSRICYVFRPETAIATRRVLKTKQVPCGKTCLASRIESPYRRTRCVCREQPQETLRRHCVDVGSLDQTALRASASLGFLARAVVFATRRTLSQSVSDQSTSRSEKRPSEHCISVRCAPARRYRLLKRPRWVRVDSKHSPADGMQGKNKIENRNMANA